MTVSQDILKSGPYNTDGTTKAFAATFQYLEDSDIVVTLLNTTTGATAVGVLNTDYTVVDNVSPIIGGTITIANNGFGGIANASGIILAGYTITLNPAIPILQAESYPNGGLFPSAGVEQALDRLTLIAQGLQLATSQSLKFPVTDSATISNVLPNSTLRANMLLGFDSNGNPIASSGTGSVTISSVMVPVVQATSLQIAAKLLLNGNIVSAVPLIVDTNVFEQFTYGVNSYAQEILQNTNNSATASADIVINNNLGTPTTYYGNFGMNSSGFTGSGAFNAANAVYLTATSGDLAIGTTTANAIHFVVNNGATDAMTISSAGLVTIPSTNITTIAGNTNFTGVPTVAAAPAAGDNSLKLIPSSYVDRGASGASEVLLATATASNSASIQFTSIPSGYDQYELRLTNVIPATSGTIQMTWSENNGSSYISSGYRYAQVYANNSGGGKGDSSSSTSAIELGSSIQNGAGISGVNGIVRLNSLGSSSLYKTAVWDIGYDHSSAFIQYVGGFGDYLGDTNVINAILINFSSGNIVSGNFALYGIRKT